MLKNFIGYTQGAGSDQAPTLYFENGRITQEHADIDNIGKDVLSLKDAAEQLRANVTYDKGSKKWEAVWKTFPRDKNNKEELERVNQLLNEEIPDEVKRINVKTFLYEYRKYGDVIHQSHNLDDYHTHRSRGEMYPPDREITRELAISATQNYPEKPKILIKQIKKINEDINVLLDGNKKSISKDQLDTIKRLEQERDRKNNELIGRMTEIKEILYKKWETRLGRGRVREEDIERIASDSQNSLQELAENFLEALEKRSKIIKDNRRERDFIDDRIMRRRIVHRYSPYRRPVRGGRNSQRERNFGRRPGGRR